VHEKLKWLAYKERRSRQVLLVEIPEQTLDDV
jgi:hypothetical protein